MVITPEVWPYFLLTLQVVNIRPRPLKHCRSITSLHASIAPCFTAAMLLCCTSWWKGIENQKPAMAINAYWPRSHPSLDKSLIHQSSFAVLFDLSLWKHLWMWRTRYCGHRGIAKKRGHFSSRNRSPIRDSEHHLRATQNWLNLFQWVTTHGLSTRHEHSWNYLVACYPVTEGLIFC